MYGVVIPAGIGPAAGGKEATVPLPSRVLTGDIGGFAHDWRHLAPDALRALLAANPARVRAVAAFYGIATRDRTVARLIDEVVAYRAAWPRPA